jgi:NodT family efflux transporter outer membrane factor (OMF) lipoprotein
VKTSLTPLSAALALALLAGCASDGGLKPQARILSANTLVADHGVSGAAVSPAAWPASDWYARYGDDQLDALVREAVAANPSLKMADARVRQAAGFEAMADANLSPQLAAAAKTNRQLFSANSNVPKPLAGSWAWSNDASLNLSYELDFWGKNQAGLDAAIGRQHAAEVEAQAARLMLAVAITQTYLRLSQSWAQLDLAEAIVVQREHVLRLTAERVGAHLDSAVDLKQAETAVPLAKEQVAASREAIALLRYQLAALLGAGPDRGDSIARPAMHKTGVPAIPSVLPSELIARRPDVVAQRWRVEAAGQDIKVAKAQFLPSFNLGALIGLQSLGFDRLLQTGSRVNSASGALNLPIFDGGRLRGNLAVRDADYDLAVEQYNLTLVDAVRDVVSQLASIKALNERAALQEQALQSAQQAYALSLQRYQAGVGNYLQVLSTQVQVLTLSRASIDFEARAVELDISLVRALGGGYQAAGDLSSASTTSISAR